MNRKIAMWIVPVAALVFIFVGVVSSTSDTPPSVAQTSQLPTTNTATINEAGTIVSYQGRDGSTALDLLKQYTSAETKQSSLGEYVISINGVGGGTDKYWLYYVDDKPAQVGADVYETSNTEVIEWRYE